VKLPAWSFELLRDTNAPFDRVVEKLMDGEHYYEWHPRHRLVAPRVVMRDEARAEIEHQEKPIPGVEERSCYEIQRRGERVILLYKVKFKGLPVLLLMAYWRIKSTHLWERFVETL